jgi:hypothetical protein
MAPEDISRLYAEIKVVLVLLAGNVAAETLLYSTWGILIAGGDSRYATIVDQICFLAIVVVPILVLHFIGAAILASLIYVLATLWLIVNQILLYMRYKSLKWHRKLV